MKPETRDDGERAAANRLPADESRGHLMVQIARTTCRHWAAMKPRLRCIGLTLADRRQCERVICVAAGAGKQIVALDALQAGVFTILVTDEATATFALEHAHDR